MKLVRVHLLAALVVLGPLAGLACDAKHTAASHDSSEGQVLDTEILAFLSLARAGHHQADILEGTGDVDGAVASLERIVLRISLGRSTRGTSSPTARSQHPRRSQKSRNRSRTYRTRAPNRKGTLPHPCGRCSRGPPRS